MSTLRRGREPAGFETRPWGGFQTIEEGRGYKVKRLLVQPGQRLSLQRHRYRAEHWVVVTGSPNVIISGRRRRLKARGSVDVPRGAWHRIENPGRVPVVLIEVQHGPYLGEDDIIRRHDDYGRAGEAKTKTRKRQHARPGSSADSPSTPHSERTTPMPIQTRYLFSAAMDVDPAQERLFNEVYDREHVPSLLTVPGVVAVSRYELQPLTMSIGGQLKTIVIEHAPKYGALYEIESPEVLISDAWAKAVEQGRWPAQVRPHTRNRQHTLYRRIAP